MGAPSRPHCLSIDLRRLPLRPQSKPCVCGGGESGSDPLYPKAVYIQLILLLLVAVPEIKSEPEPSPALTALALLGTGAARCCDEPTWDRSPREGDPGRLRTAEKAP